MRLLFYVAYHIYRMRLDYLVYDFVNEEDGIEVIFDWANGG